MKTNKYKVAYFIEDDQGFTNMIPKYTPYFVNGIQRTTSMWNVIWFSSATIFEKEEDVIFYFRRKINEYRLEVNL